VIQANESENLIAEAQHFTLVDAVTREVVDDPELEVGFEFADMPEAGGLPVAGIMWGWGPEGRRVIAVVNASLLGGSSRPSLQ